MNRLNHLSQTLPKNIADNSDCDELEFVVLNYNSSDEMDEWIRDTQMPLIKEGRLIYIRELSAKHFRPAHSRNVCARMASGDVICNVDSDNFTKQGFATFLSGLFSTQGLVIANTYDFWSLQELSTHGRIALRRWHFMKLGGYDESQVGWGAEDGDLSRRCIEMGFTRHEIPQEYFRCLEHDDNLRIQYVDFSDLPDDPSSQDSLSIKMNSNKVNRVRSVQRVKLGKYVANIDQPWGKASVIRNFTEPIELTNPWVPYI